MFPSGFTHERLHPWWGLLTTTRRAFYCFSRLAHQLPCDLAHHLRFCFCSDPYSELQGVPSVLLAIGTPYASSKIDPAVFTESDARSMLSAPGGQSHTVLFRGQNVLDLVP